MEMVNLWVIGTNKVHDQCDFKNQMGVSIYFLIYGFIKHSSTQMRDRLNTNTVSTLRRQVNQYGNESQLVS